MRPLKTTDVYKMSRILKKINIRVDTETTKLVNGKEKTTAKTQNQLGAEMILAIGENLHQAENEVNDFLAELIGITKEEFSNLPITETFKYIEEFKQNEDVKSFFKLAGQLMK